MMAENRVANCFRNRPGGNTFIYTRFSRGIRPCARFGTSPIRQLPRRALTRRSRQQLFPRVRRQVRWVSRAQYLLYASIIPGGVGENQYEYSIYIYIYINDEMGWVKNKKK